MQVRKMALCGLFGAMLALCSWLSLPLGTVAFTLQTFGAALALYLLGGKLGTLAILVWLLTGAVGLPVFSGFRGGVGTLLGTTGGYLTGFLLWGLVYWLLTALLPRCRLPALIVGLLCCYGFGSWWYWYFYGKDGILLILYQCVLPFLLPDAVKLTLAVLLGRRLKHILQRNSP